MSVYFYGLVRLLRVSLVARVTARSLHNNMLGCLSPFGEVSGHEISMLQHSLLCIMLVTLA